MGGSPSPGAFGADLSPQGRGGDCGTVAPQVHLSPLGRGRERSSRVRGTNISIALCHNATCDGPDDARAARRRRTLQALSGRQAFRPNRAAAQALLRRPGKAPAGLRSRRCQLHRRQGRNRRPRRRIRLRQVHAGARRHAAPRSDRWRHQARPARTLAHAGQALCRRPGPQAHPDGVPGRRRQHQTRASPRSRQLPIRCAGCASSPAPSCAARSKRLRAAAACRSNC